MRNGLVGFEAPTPGGVDGWLNGFRAGKALREFNHPLTHFETAPAPWGSLLPQNRGFTALRQNLSRLGFRRPLVN